MNRTYSGPLQYLYGIYITQVSSAAANDDVERGSSEIESGLAIERAQVRISFPTVSKVGNFSFSPRCPSSLSCISQYLDINGGGNINMSD